MIKLILKNSQTSLDRVRQQLNHILLEIQFEYHELQMEFDDQVSKNKISHLVI